MLGSLNDLASLARFEIEDNPSIDFVTLAIKLAETPCVAQIRVPEDSLFGSPGACHFVIGPDPAAAD